MNLLEARKVNCLSHWYPIIEKVVPTPKTLVFRTDANLIELLDNKTPDGLGELLAGLTLAGAGLGYPFFLRTGQTSGKHDWNETCLVKSAADILSHVAALVEYSELVDICGLPYDVWVAREMLPTVAIARTSMGMPIVKEFRFFVSGEKIKCFHPYWPADAIERYVRGVDFKSDEWAKAYQSLCCFKSIDEEVFVSMLAAMVGKAIGGEWSVDLLETERGWYVTDMATASMSYHWQDCPNNPEQDPD